jgi:hypothetical protein
MKSIKSTGRNWMENATFVGETMISGRNCYHWTNAHEYYTNGEDFMIIFYSQLS